VIGGFIADPPTEVVQCWTIVTATRMTNTHHRHHRGPAYRADPECPRIDAMGDQIGSVLGVAAGQQAVVNGVKKPVRTDDFRWTNPKKNIVVPQHRERVMRQEPLPRSVRDVGAVLRSGSRLEWPEMPPRKNSAADPTVLLQNDDADNRKRQGPDR